MLILKRLIFAPIFIVIFIILLSQLNILFKSYDLVFSLSINTLIILLTVSFSILLTSFFFVLFSTMALDWKYIIPVGILASILPFMFVESSLGVIFMVGILIALLLTYVSLENTMKSYLTFLPAALLGPSIRHLISLLIVVISLVYFFSVSKIISDKGFEIPDSLIDEALKLTPISQGMGQENIPSLPSIPPEQIEFLKQNPDLLKQYGLDPAILDNLDQPQIQQAPADLTSGLIKQTVKDQLQNVIKPYINFVPAALAVILFFTLSGLTSFINLLVYPLLWGLFYLFEKTGFIKFTEEMRPVKKMVV